MAKHAAMTALVRAIALAPALLAACSAAGAPEPSPSPWETDRYRDICAALWSDGREQAMIGVSNVPNMAGITLVGDSTAFAREGRFEPDLRLAVNGTQVPVTAIGVASGRHRGVMLRFDPSPLLRRYPDGFTLVLSRGEAPLSRLKLEGASAAFAEVAKCAATLPKPAGAGSR